MGSDVGRRLEARGAVVLSVACSTVGGMQLGAITRGGVLQAIAEHDQLGREVFLATYGFGAATRYALLHEGREYDSKAISGVAHRYDFGRALTPSEFSGGRGHAVDWLEREGFTVIEVSKSVELPKAFVRRVGSVRRKRVDGTPLHRPLLLLWALGQAVAGAPRLQSWATIQDALAPLLERYAGVEHGADGARYPFWALVRDDLWMVERTDELSLTSQGRRPTLESLNRVNPAGGLPAEDYELIQTCPEVAAEAAAGLLLRYFYPLPEGIIDDLGLKELLTGRWADALRPLPGEHFSDRSAIWRAHGGQKQAGIGHLGDGVLSVFSDEKGPYADGRLPDTNWIAYVGDGLSGAQQLVDGNQMLAEHQAARRPLRFWHRPYRQQFTFETWAVIVQRRLRWGLGDDGEWRQEFLWIMAPVPSPMPENWPAEVVDALDGDTGETYDETTEYLPGDIDPAAQPATESDQDAYRRLNQSATTSAKRRGQAKRPSLIDRYVRSQSARAAVIRRSRGLCENPQCAGHPTERTTAGEPILQVDHVHDLGKGGEDLPWNMIALCPNCHALKTYGANREKLGRVLRQTARRRHDDALGEGKGVAVGS